MWHESYHMSPYMSPYMSPSYESYHMSTGQTFWAVRSHSNAKNVFMNSYKKLEWTNIIQILRLKPYSFYTNGIHTDHELSRSVINGPCVEHNKVKSSWQPMYGLFHHLLSISAILSRPEFLKGPSFFINFHPEKTKLSEAKTSHIQKVLLL